jgi:hypothetical protein
MTFLHESVAVKATWQAAIASESSHVEPFAKGCLMARVSLDADSAYAAMCRPASDHPMRMQYRKTKGGDTVSIEASGRPGWSLPGVFFARLRVSGAQVVGEASPDGVGWATVGQVTLPEAPTLQGVAASGHSSATPVRFLFLDPTRTETGSPTPFDKGAGRTQSCVGNCKMHVFFNGTIL